MNSVLRFRLCVLAKKFEIPYVKPHAKMKNMPFFCFVNNFLGFKVRNLKLGKIIQSWPLSFFAKFQVGASNGSKVIRLANFGFPMG